MSNSDEVEISRTMLDFYLKAMDLVDPEGQIEEFVFTFTDNSFSVSFDPDDE